MAITEKYCLDSHFSGQVNARIYWNVKYWTKLNYDKYKYLYKTKIKKTIMGRSLESIAKCKKYHVKKLKEF